MHLVFSFCQNTHFRRLKTGEQAVEAADYRRVSNYYSIEKSEIENPQNKVHLEY